MVTVKGNCNTALVYADDVDTLALGQIQVICDTEAFSDCKIRMMSDVHAGKGCCVGTTMTIHDKVVPAMVGVDIGCGMETVELLDRDVDFDKLDRTIRQSIPFGMKVREGYHPYNEKIDLTQLCCFRKIKHAYAQHSLGSLGGGNHFIELDKDSDGNLYLVIHSGSRHLGTEVANYYQAEGFNWLKGCTRIQLETVIAQLKVEGRACEIQQTLSTLSHRNLGSVSVPEELAYVSGSLLEDYLHDMSITQRFAMLNRKAMADILVRGMDFQVKGEFTTIHNYIDLDSMILRKGAVSAKTGERLLIPINMRDGSLICIGKGNEEWNCSAPHGAGRRLSRRKAFETLDIEEYKRQMEGIYSTCVGKDTLDESPNAYKPLSVILENISPTVDVINHIVPVFNFKASE